MRRPLTILRNNKYELMHDEATNDVVLDLVMDAQLHLKEEQHSLEKQRTHLHDNKELRNFVDIETQPLYESRLFKFGNLTSKSLKIVGIVGQNLMVETGTDVECRMNIGQLADVLENELELITNEANDDLLATRVLRRELEKWELIVNKIEKDLPITAAALQQNKQDIGLANMMLLTAGVIGGIMASLVYGLHWVDFYVLGGLWGAGKGLLLACTIGYIGTALGNHFKRRILFKELLDKLQPNLDRLMTLEDHIKCMEQEINELMTKRSRISKQLCFVKSNIHIFNHAIAAGLGGGLSVRFCLRGEVFKLSQNGVIDVRSVLRNLFPKLAGRGCVIFSMFAGLMGVLIDLVFLVFTVKGFKKKSYPACKLAIISNDLKYEFGKAHKRLECKMEELAKKREEEKNTENSSESRDI